MKRGNFSKRALAGASLALLPLAALADQGPSTQQDSQFVPSDPASGVRFISIASNGNGVLTPNETYLRLNTGVNDYRLVGVPDGMGGFRSATDIADGTFTLLVNHEAGANAGIVRRHGNRGAFVSAWKIRAQASNLQVIGAQDLGETYYTWNLVTNSYDAWNAANPMPAYVNNVLAPPPAVAPFDGIGRHCAADMAEPGAYRFGSVGTDARILLNGEEIGAPGRAWAYIASGPETGTSWELPVHGDYSWENSVANPFAQEKTIVIGADDSTPGNIYVYVGTKQAGGIEIEKAGLTNGVVYGIVIDNVTITSGQAVEDRTWILGNSVDGVSTSKPFRMRNLSSLTNVTGAQLQLASDTGPDRIINWLRPEDAAWSRAQPNVAYFVTTDSFSGNSRIWELRFTDITQPELGGVATMLGDGSVPASFTGGIISATGITDGRMFDNFGVTRYNQLLIQEDVGNNPRLGRIWLYDIDTDTLVDVGIARASQFLMGQPNFITQDEESSGIIDASEFLGSGWYVLNNQAHAGIAGELVEFAQLMAVYVPQAACVADVDLNGAVELADLAALLSGFGTVSGALASQGDVDFDGDVDLDDLARLLSRFGSFCN